MFGVLAAVAFAIAVLMHVFGWGSGKADVTTFALIGLLCLCLHLVTGAALPWRRGS